VIVHQSVALDANRLRKLVDFVGLEPTGEVP